MNKLDLATIKRLNSLIVGIWVVCLPLIILLLIPGFIQPDVNNGYYLGFLFISVMLTPILRVGTLKESKNEFRKFLIKVFLGYAVAVVIVILIPYIIETSLTRHQIGEITILMLLVIAAVVFLFFLVVLISGMFGLFARENKKDL
ncbi:hypothetical protein L6R44_11285 [Enterobacter cloacae complex sp. ECC445]|uniref:hypothetical protein n=1 Tax=Enterobacter cloacae complex sp. ECC445 TaxID=2913213 RepID=UPI001F1B123E|nr:hypothetical protein [Enterobacter cloacae complex sp. ECC445]MCG0456690.1 hypothetical protein [Enterobacter cloacae complex sp. ECC445]